MADINEKDVTDILRTVDSYYENKQRMKERSLDAQIESCNRLLKIYGPVHVEKDWKEEKRREEERGERAAEKNKLQKLSMKEALAFYKDKRHKQEAKRNKERLKSFVFMILPIIGVLFIRSVLFGVLNYVLCVFLKP